ncbi:TatD family hydrolase [Leptothrix ochracea]|uniref:TatD family hydrolase n=2 Tax=Leptothrix ochracea TaxID=735331 RepID=UPI0034E20B2E
MYVDSHCHLNFPELLAQWPQIRTQMQAADVQRAICIGTSLEAFDALHALVVSEPGLLWATVGVHPDNDEAREPSFDALVERAGRERVVAIGETGLDYYRLNGRSVADMAWQRERFRTHIRAARAVHKPLVVHTRQSAPDTLQILRDEQASEVGGVMHCFTETLDVALAALDLGFYISFSGILTFRNAADLREVAKAVPLERCLIETDSPYLAPAPHRGKLNTPALVPLVAAELARIKGLAVEEVAEATSNNAAQLFKLNASA